MKSSNPRRLAATLILAAAAFCLAASASAQQFKWKRTVINEKSDFEAAGVADLNKDGHLDIICGDHWYEGPEYKKTHFIYEIPNADYYRIDFANIPMDVNGDGWMDIVSNNWHAMSVVWRKNPGAAGGTWEQTVVDRPGNQETAMTADVDGDGKVDFLPDVAQKTVWYRLENAGPDGKLVPYVVSDKIGGHGIGFGDVNGDGRGDIVKPGGWFEAPTDRLKGEWLWHPEFNLGAASIAIVVNDFTGDGLADLFWCNGHDFGTFWMEQTKESDPAKKWIKHEIDKDWSQGHAIQLVDLDGDGKKEILTGKRKYAHKTDPGAEDPMCIYIYSFDAGSKSFKREEVHKGDGDGMGLSFAVSDIDGDGDLDFVAPGQSGLYLYQQERSGGPSAPKKAQSEMKVPDGFEVTLFASEPEIRKPIAMAFDERGRMVVAEAAMYPLGPRPGEEPSDTVKILEDTDQDGVADKITVFADGLNIPDAVAVGHGGIYVAEAPNLWFMQDTDGDGRADQKKKILTGFGTQDSHHNVHGLQWTPEGKLLMNQGCSTTSKIRSNDPDSPLWDLKEGDFFRCWPDGTAFEIPHKGFTNSWGYDWDDHGNWFCNDNEGPHLIHLVDGADYGFSLTNRHDGKPGTLPGMAREYGDKRGYLVQAGMTVYSGDAFPEEYDGNIIQGAPKLHRVIRDSVSEDGATFYAHLEEDLMSTSDPWHLPIAMHVGPDGAVYITDWYNEILAHVEHPLDSPRRDHARGRIYRVAWKQAPKRAIPDLRQASTAELAANLRSANKWVRRTSQRLLAAKGPEALQAALPLLDAQKEKARTRCHALWTIEETRLAEKPESREAVAEAVLGALKDPSPYVRAAALRAARHIGLQGPSAAALYAKLATDPDGFVKFEAGLALSSVGGKLPLEQVIGIIATAQWDDLYLGYAFGRAIKPYEEKLVMQAFALGGRALNEEGEKYLPALLHLRDPRTEPLFLSMLQLEGLKPHVAEQVAAGLQGYKSPAVLHGLAQFVAARPSLSANLVRPILEDVRRRDPKEGANDESVREALLALEHGGDPVLLRDVFLTAAHIGYVGMEPAILNAFDLPDARASEAAILAAGRLRLQSAAPALADRLASAQGRRRWAIIHALADLKLPEGAGETMLTALADPDLAPDALRSLRKLENDALLDHALTQLAAGRAVMDLAAARQWREWVDQSGGEQASARRERLAAREGILRDWQIIGPFPNPDAKGHAAPYPPESEIKLDAEYEYLGLKLHWKPMRADDPQGIVSLGGVEGPRDHVVAYGYAKLDAAHAGPATLFCGSDDSIKVWLNGALVHDNLVDRGLSYGQDQVAVSLKEGENTVLVKCGQNAGGWNFHARIETLPPQLEGGGDDREKRALFMPGDPARGQAVFFGKAGCARCHAVGERGGRVGPDLSEVARLNPKSYIVRSILKPSEEIAEGFGGVTIATADGKSLDGYILRETPDEVFLVGADGKTAALKKADIKERRSRAASGMPDDIADSLTAAELTDVAAFLGER